MELKHGYKKTEVGLIPEEWGVSEIQDAYEILNNLRLPISEKVREKMQGKYPYYGPTKIQDYINEYRLNGEYALIGEDGDHFLKWRTIRMTLLATGKFNVNNHAHILKGINNNTKWFYWYFNHRDVTPYLSRQGAGRYKLNKSTLKSIKMCIPPLPEQHAISTALSDIDTLINSMTKLINKKKSIKQRAMQELLTGKKRLEGYSGEWAMVQLKDITTTSSGGTPSRSNPNYFMGNIPWVTTGELNDKIIIDTKEHITKDALDNSSAKMFPVHTILIAMYGATIGKLGILSKPSSTNQACCGLICKSDVAYYKFLYYKLFAIRDYIISLGCGAGQPNISQAIVKSLEISLPELPEQFKIAAVLSDMESEIEKLEQEMNKLNYIKQGMMQELLTGRIRLLGEVAQ